MCCFGAPSLTDGTDRYIASLIAIAFWLSKNIDATTLADGLE